MYKGAKVLVAGATGLIGSNVLLKLLSREARVRGTLHKKGPSIKDSRIEYVPCDLTNMEDCRKAVKGIDYAFLCAANTSGAAVMASNPVSHITTNLKINSQFFEAAWEAGLKKVLFISSSSVYPPVEYPVKEEEAFLGDPYDAYFAVGWMKRYTEKLSEFYTKRYGLSVVVIRPTNTYGPYDKFDPETSHVLPALIRRALMGEDPFQVWGDGSAVRDFIYVEDLADAMVDSLEKCSGHLALNVGSGRLVTIREAVGIILTLAGRSGAKVVYDASKPSTIPKRVVDLSKVKRMLGFEAKTAFEDGIQKTVDWYRGILKR